MKKNELARQADRLDDIESSPVCYAVCFVNDSTFGLNWSQQTLFSIEYFSIVAEMPLKAKKNKIKTK